MSTTPKKPRHSWTIRAFGGAAIAALVSLILHYSGSLVLGAEALGGAWTALLTSILGVGLRYRTTRPLLRRRGGGGTPVLLVLLVLLLGGCGTAIGDSLERAGVCLGRCSIGCATSWVAELLTMAERSEGPGAVQAELPQDGAELVYHVEGPTPSELYSVEGRLVGDPMPIGAGRFVGRFEAGGGVTYLVPLSPEPRAYCASPEAAEGSQPAPSGYVPANPPRSRCEFEERFGLLPHY